MITKLPHYVLPLYPAIAILTAGALERRVLSRSWLRRGAAWWFVIPAGASVIAVIGAIKQSETRARAVGYDTPRYKWAAFTLSSVFAGLAGADH